MSANLPPLEELLDAFEDIERIHKIYLAQHGVKLPNKQSHKWVWLAMLHHARGEPVHKNLISDATRREFPDAARDQQVRHLKRDGWNYRVSYSRQPYLRRSL